jgi:predicted transcriptional regulator
MMSVTIHMPEELLTKVRSIAESNNGDLDSLINETMEQLVRHNDARMRFEQRASRGRGREQEALTLLNR